MTASVAQPTRRSRRQQRRSRATFTSVLGELLLTAGVLVFLFVAWQMWIGDLIISAQTNSEGHAVSQEWAELPPPEPPPAVEEDDGSVWYEPPVLEHPDNGVRFAQMHIPRFGPDYNVPLAGGTSRPVTLDNGWAGVYDQSVMPGQVGNFSIAGHRTTWGFPLNRIDKLRLNDAVVVEAEEGWYTYRFRTLEYVKPTQVDVLLDVPQAPELTTDERYMTLTACSPLYSLAERIVGYAVFEGFQPRVEGAPDSLAPVDEVASLSW